MRIKPEAGGRFNRMNLDWTGVRAAMEEGFRTKVFSAACLLVGVGGRILFEEAWGRLSDEEEAAQARPETIFDLASLTKVLATTLACLGLIDSGDLDPDRPLGESLGLAPHLAGLRPSHLLAHTSGLPAWRPFYKELLELPLPRRARRLAGLLAGTGLEYEPETRTLYSDLNFMLLQLLIEELTGQSLAGYLGSRFYQPLGVELRFILLDQGPGELKERIAATERCPWRGRLLKGEVNDDNAWAMGGVAGQAGLFGPAREVFRLLAWLRDSLGGRAAPFLLKPETAGLILTRPFPGQPRTHGFDVPAEEGSAAGELFGPGAIGHLGFTGTSLWMEPGSGLTVILLTNRTIFGRDNNRIRPFRPKIHNLVKGVLEE
jgi:CubicO group peptidase (beta-lactamase class C family)